MKATLYFFWFLAIASLAATLFAGYKIMFTDDWNFFLAGWLPWIGLSITSLLMGLAEKVERTRDTRFRLLLALAAADGNISDEEAATLKVAAKTLGISNRRIKKDFEALSKGTLEYAIPEDYEEKKNLLTMMIAMMKVDNKIEEKELALIFSLGEKLGFSESYIKSSL
jgi:uncharacterized tellurite resistance protein B-like protein